MGATVFSQVWKAYDVWCLRDDLGNADRPVLRRSPAWSEDASALYVDSLINGFPLTPMVVQSCRDSQGRGVLRVLDGWRRVEAVVAFGEDRLRLPSGFVFRGETWGGETVEAGGVILGDAGASFADAVRSHGDPDVLAMSDLLLIVNTADMMCGPDGVPVSFDERLSDVEARYGVGSRQAVDVGEMLSVLRRSQTLRRILTCRMLRERRIRCRRFSRPFARPTIRVHVLRLRGRQRTVQGGSRGCWRAWRGVALTLKCFRVRAYAV